MQFMRVSCSWSGGKDSCFALMLCIQQGAVPAVLVNMMNENGKISRSHGLPFALLEQQAQAMELPVVAIPTSWKEYEKTFIHTLQETKSVYDLDAMDFGDIDLQAHRDWEEAVCQKAGMQALLPLWQRNRKELLLEMLANGIETMIVSCNAVMGETFLGQYLDHHMIGVLESMNIDVCGENGEFHTLVVHCPLFKKRVQLPPFTKTKQEDYHFLVWDT